MANHKQALKRHRQSLRRNEANRQRRSLVKSAIRKAREAFEAGEKGAEALVREAISQIARARSKGLLHANTAARRVARIARDFRKTQG
ncbi:MAG: 30S ribosomal protein S20 [Deltaproteobacteria bacterium]|nr:30S ribosomal protein S20 [Deltaproteobacteria bacterium]